jgi:hypothetical protein
MTLLSHASLRRVTRRNPCPICEKTDWCGLAGDETIAICMRIADGAVKETRNGGYLHILQEREFKPERVRAIQPKHSPCMASIDRRNAVYQAWLESLPLSSAHADNLGERGLSDIAIARGLYATIPQTSAAIYKSCAALVERFGPLQGVPGFYPDHEGKWRIPPYASGFLIPVRDAQGRIQSCQIRFDSNKGGARHIWLSSNPEKHSGGTSAQAAIHIARPWRIVATGESLITEGPLKADIISERLDVGVIALPGVSSFQSDFGQRLEALFPARRSVAIAFDSDWHHKPEVERAMLRLARVLNDAGFVWDVWDWSDAKGLDDLLAQEGGVYAAS